MIDERAGRVVARELGLKLADTAAVIGQARQQGLIPSARTLFAALHASDFLIAPEVIQAVLERCGGGRTGGGDAVSQARQMLHQAPMAGRDPGGSGAAAKSCGGIP